MYEHQKKVCEVKIKNNSTDNNSNSNNITNK